MKTNRLSHQSTHLENFAEKNELIQVSQLSRVDWYTSLLTREARDTGEAGETGSKERRHT